ncbi:YSC84-related protein [Desulfopila sp. IMCC35008]|uniref:lipid-binding SYLF domain-containing protein n=1 Tax=Desulfopila sp. IMCC35008 TaxID=2653858 RepID=UPI00197AB63B|nr:YSC84-related protein [Desulfopila sp. IMCC35008]
MKRCKLLVYGLSLVMILFASAIAANSSQAAAKEEIEQQRVDIRKMADNTLERLYKTQPTAKKAIEKSAGYAVFSNFGMKILVLGGGSGKGIAVYSKSKKEVFMKMVELQAGLGMGIKKFRLIWVFENQSDLDNFVNSGWEFGGQGTVAAQASGEGGSFAGAMSVTTGVWLYQLTDDGLALELTAKGTKYYKDDKLN